MQSLYNNRELQVNFRISVIWYSLFLQRKSVAAKIMLQRKALLLFFCWSIRLSNSLGLHAPDTLMSTSAFSSPRASAAGEKKRQTRRAPRRTCSAMSEAEREKGGGKGGAREKVLTIPCLGLPLHFHPTISAHSFPFNSLYEPASS